VSVLERSHVIENRLTKIRNTDYWRGLARYLHAGRWYRVIPNPGTQKLALHAQSARSNLPVTLQPTCGNETRVIGNVTIFAPRTHYALLCASVYLCPTPARYLICTGILHSGKQAMW